MLYIMLTDLIPGNVKSSLPSALRSEGCDSGHALSYFPLVVLGHVTSLSEVKLQNEPFVYEQQSREHPGAV